MDNFWEAVVVGGGPAGLSAALMLGRARRSTLVIDAREPRNRFAAHMHGVLGNEGAPPGVLLAQGRADAARYGVQFCDGTAVHVDDTDPTLTLTLDDGTTRRARALVVAAGITDELPDIPGLKQRWGRSVLHCPYCHGWEVRHQRLGVLVTGPAGLHQAQLVRQWSDDVTVFAPDGLDAAAQRGLHSRGVDVLTEPVVDVLGDEDKLTAVQLGDGRVVGIDALFTAGVPVPHDGFLSGLALDRSENPFGGGSFLSVDAVGRTSHPRVWAVGNVVNPNANVPMSIGAGALTGGGVNGALVAEDFDHAAHEQAADV